MYLKRLTGDSSVLKESTGGPRVSQGVHRRSPQESSVYLKESTGGPRVSKGVHRGSPQESSVNLKESTGGPRVHGGDRIQQEEELWRDTLWSSFRLQYNHLNCKGEQVLDHIFH